MSTWIVPCNYSFFRLDDYLQEFNEIVWSHRSNFEVGDIIYIYATAPLKRLTYVLEVVRTNISQEESDTNYNDSAYSITSSQSGSGWNNKLTLLRLLNRIPLQSQARLTLNDLREHGCTASIQSSIKVKGSLLDYVQTEIAQSNTKNNDCEVDYPDNSDAFYEGAVMKVLANRYERNIKARHQCIKKHGCKCCVCGCDFSERYGKLGEGFIHVHHLVPIGNIGKEYVLDPVKDLVPVCPNCHYMLHRSNPPMKPDELKKLLNLED